MATSFQCGSHLQLLRKQRSIGLLSRRRELAIRWFWHHLGFEVGSVLTTPRSGQGRGARVASDPRKERIDGSADPSDRERPLH